MNNWKQLKAKVERLLNTYEFWQARTGREAQMQTSVLRRVIQHNIIKMKHENPQRTSEFIHAMGIRPLSQ